LNKQQPNGENVFIQRAALSCIIIKSYIYTLYIFMYMRGVQWQRRKELLIKCMATAHSGRKSIYAKARDYHRHINTRHTRHNATGK
jgi:hypothetical protein